MTHVSSTTLGYCCESTTPHYPRSSVSIPTLFSPPGARKAPTRQSEFKGNRVLPSVFKQLT
eukprot:1208272-Amphidinium_carterae.1